MRTTACDGGVYDDAGGCDGWSAQGRSDLECADLPVLSRRDVGEIERGVNAYLKKRGWNRPQQVGREKMLARAARECG